MNTNIRLEVVDLNCNWNFNEHKAVTFGIVNLLPTYNKPLVRHMSLSGRTVFWSLEAQRRGPLLSPVQQRDMLSVCSSCKPERGRPANTGRWWGSKELLNSMAGEGREFWCTSQLKLIQEQLIKFQFQCAVHAVLCAFLSKWASLLRIPGWMGLESSHSPRSRPHVENSAQTSRIMSEDAWRSEHTTWLPQILVGCPEAWCSACWDARICMQDKPAWRTTSHPWACPYVGQCAHLKILKALLDAHRDGTGLLSLTTNIPLCGGEGFGGQLPSWCTAERRGEI